MSGNSGDNQHPVVYCDTIHAAGLHKGNVRLLLTRFDVEGRATPALELILPSSEIKALIMALQKIAR